MMISKRSVLGFFLVLTSCTQLPPPVSGKAVGSLDPQDPQSSTTSTFLSLDDSDSSYIKLALSGDDAGKIFRLMGIAPESAASPTKVGRDFTCSKNGEKNICEFLVRIPEGAFAIQREENALKPASPEMAQVKESDAYISIVDPSEGPRIRLQVLDAYAEKIFNALQVARTFDLTPDQENGPGVRKAAEQIDCYQRSKAATPQQKTYDCYLNLNTETGSVIPVDPSVQQTRS